MKDKVIIYTSWNLNPKEGTGVATSVNNIIINLKSRGVKFEFIKNDFSYKPFSLLLIKRIISNIIFRYKIKKYDYKRLLGIDFDGFLIKKRGKYILNIRTNFSDIKEHEKGWLKFLCRIEELMQRVAIKKADKIIVQSEYTKNRIIKDYKIKNKEIIVIPNRIDNKKFNYKGIDNKNEKIILSVAGLYPRKGILELIEALKILKDKGIDFRHIHIGSGLMNRIINKKVKRLNLEKVSYFIGSKNTSFISKMYKKSTIFCHPALQEDFGNVFLEAMASGKPIVAFNNSNNETFVKNGINGFLVKNNDIKSLAYHLEYLLKNDRLCKRMGNESLKMIKFYSWDKTTVRILKEIRKD
ncbi:MAG: glycosyltransferase family 4 protein [Nanoarchaeota archaeon]